MSMANMSGSIIMADNRGIANMSGSIVMADDRSNKMSMAHGRSGSIVMAA